MPAVGKMAYLPANVFARRADSGPAEVPIVGQIIAEVLSLATISVLAICLVRRLQNIVSWKRLPMTSWLLVIIYIDSFLFVFLSAILARGVGINSSGPICQAAILLCLICYMSTKVLIYYFLVERAYIVRGSVRPRLKDWLYLFNFFGMILPYVVVIVLNFIWRIGYIDKNGTCIIGMQKRAMLPLIIFDVVINVYMTLLFVMPLRKLYSYRHKTNTALRTVAFRSFLGSCATLTSSVVNLTVLMILNGEPGWICLMCCNADILFSVIVLHWVTSIDSTRSSVSHTPADASKRSADRSANGRSTGKGPKNRLSPPHLAQVVEFGTGSVKTEIAANPNPDANIQMDGIVVKTTQLREVEDGRSDASSTTGDKYHGRNGSEDSIVGN